MAGMFDSARARIDAAEKAMQDENANSTRRREEARANFQKTLSPAFDAIRQQVSEFARELSAQSWDAHASAEWAFDANDNVEWWRTRVVFNPPAGMQGRALGSYSTRSPLFTVDINLSFRVVEFSASAEPETLDAAGSMKIPLPQTQAVAVGAVGVELIRDYQEQVLAHVLENYSG
ncbi:hypothetical protein [Herbaspirillum rubrisubalbicans]|nr:hypothetical protein [Herbaspirillum rubrisubalbicans]